MYTNYEISGFKHSLLKLHRIYSRNMESENKQYLSADFDEFENKILKLVSCNITIKAAKQQKHLSG
jgi:hypothetical protein